jgi:hypothetical protein
MKLRSFIAYGIILAETLPMGEEEDDWSDYIVHKHGLKRPKGTFKGNEESFKSYWRLKDALLKKLNISIEQYGDVKSYKNILCIKDSLEYTLEGYETLLGPLTVDKTWNGLLESVISKSGLKPASSPNWWLLNAWNV